jgi:hypothetical protein
MLDINSNKLTFIISTIEIQEKIRQVQIQVAILFYLHISTFSVNEIIGKNF